MAKYLIHFSFHSRSTGLELVAGFGNSEPIEATEQEIREEISMYSELFIAKRVESVVLYSPGDAEYSEIALPRTFIDECFVKISTFLYAN